MAANRFGDIIPAPGETYGNASPEQWREGLRWANMLARAFAKKRPFWADLAPRHVRRNSPARSRRPAAWSLHGPLRALFSQKAAALGRLLVRRAEAPMGDDNEMTTTQDLEALAGLPLDALLEKALDEWEQDAALIVYDRCGSAKEEDKCMARVSRYRAALAAVRAGKERG